MADTHMRIRDPRWQLREIVTSVRTTANCVSNCIASRAPPAVRLVLRRDGEVGKLLTTAKSGTNSFFANENNFALILKTGIKEATMGTRVCPGVTMSKCAGGG